MRRWKARRTASDEGHTDSEHALIHRAKDGDPDAFAALVRLHQDRVYRLAWRMVGPDSAEDVAQQAFLKAWQGLPRFDGAATFATWLHRITVNTCLDELRRAARFRPLPLDAVAEPAGEEDVAETVTDAADDAERRTALAWALEHLPSDDRALLALRVGEERSYEEIAAVLELNPRTVGTRLFRARARLHALVSGRLEESGHAVR